MFDITVMAAVSYAQFKLYYLLDFDTGQPYVTDEFMAAVKTAMGSKSYHVIAEDDVDFDDFSYKAINVKEKMYIDNRWPNGCASFITQGTWRLFKHNPPNVVGENITNVVGENITLLCITVADAFVCYLAEV